MWLCVIALLLAPDPGPDSADAVFERMANPILKCKTFQADIEIALGPGDGSTMKGRLLVAPGNKMRLKLDVSTKGKLDKMAMVSDGTKMRSTEGGDPTQDQETPKHLTENALASVGVAGVFVSVFLSPETESSGKNEPFDLGQFCVSELKLGKKEAVSGKETQSLEYKLRTKAWEDPLGVTVWIDVKTNLPVKRVVTIKQCEVTETYTKAALDGKIDDKEFELPK